MLPAKGVTSALIPETYVTLLSSTSFESQRLYQFYGQRKRGAVLTLSVFIVMNSVWLWFIPQHSTQMYGASATLGFGGSALLVTVLTMLADLIGDNVVRKPTSWL